MKTDMRRRISIIIPCYNAGEYLRASVNSALQQASQHVSLEVLVINDYSDDPTTLRVLRDIASLESVRVINNTGRRGPAAARNVGIAEASGEWTAFMDADDVFVPDSITPRLARLERFTESAWIGGDIAQCDENGKITEASYFRARPQSLQYLQPAFDSGEAICFEDTLKVFLDTPLVNTTSSIIRTAALRSIGGFDERLRLQQDLHLFLRLARQLPFVFVPTVVAINRQHTRNSTRNYAVTLRYRHAALSLLIRDRHFGATSGLRRKMMHVANELSYQFMREQHYLKAVKWRVFAALGLPSRVPTSR